MNLVRISVCCLKDLLRVLLNLCERAVDRADGFALLLAYCSSKYNLLAEKGGLPRTSDAFPSPASSGCFHVNASMPVIK
jgi:hypothetical protein